MAGRTAHVTPETVHLCTTTRSSHCRIHLHAADNSGQKAITYADGHGGCAISPLVAKTASYSHMAYLVWIPNGRPSGQKSYSPR